MPTPQSVLHRAKPAQLFFLFCASLLLASFVSAATTSDTLIGYWKFDENGATNATDSSDDGKTATAVGSGGANNTPQPSMTVNSGFGFTNTRSRHFDGTDDHFTVTDTFDPTAYTISAWIRPSDVSSVNIFVRTDASGPGVTFSHSLRITSSGHLQHYIYDGAVRVVDSTYTLTANTWYHVTGVATNSGLMNLYINGLAQSTGVVVGTMWTGGDRYYIGSTAAGGTLDYYAGLMDDVRLYSRALTETEITALANKTHTTATWDGLIGQDWEDPDNWVPAVVPDNYANIVIRDNGGDYATLSTDVEMSSLTINDDWTMRTAGYNLTFNDDGTFANNGTFELVGSETISGFRNDTDSGIVSFTGDNDNVADSFTLTNYATSFYQLSISGAEDGANKDTFYMDTGVVANGSVAIYSGILDNFDYTLYVGGDWYNYVNGSYNTTDSTVVFNKNSSTQTIVSTGTGAGKKFKHISKLGNGTLAVLSSSVVIQGNFDISGGTFNANGSTMTVLGSVTISSGSYLVKSGSQTVGSLTVSGGAFTGSTGVVDINGDLTISAGTVSFDGLNYISGSISKTGGSLFNGATSTMTFDASGTTQTVRLGGSTLSSVNHTANGTVRLLDNLIINGTFSQAQGIFEANGRSLTVNGLTTSSYSGIVNEFRMSTNTLTFNGNLIINSGSIVFTRTSGNIDVNGDFSIGGGSTLNIPTTSTMTVSGNYTRSSGSSVTDKFNVEFDGSGTQALYSINTVNGHGFHFTHSGAGTLQMVAASSFTITNFTNSAGTFDLNKTTVVVSGVFTNNANLQLYGTEPTNTPVNGVGSTVTYTYSYAASALTMKPWTHYHVVTSTGGNFSWNSPATVLSGYLSLYGSTVAMGSSGGSTLGGVNLYGGAFYHAIEGISLTVTNDLNIYGGVFEVNIDGSPPGLSVTGNYYQSGGRLTLGPDNDIYVDVTGNFYKGPAGTIEILGAAALQLVRNSGVQTFEYHGTPTFLVQKDNNGIVQVVNSDLSLSSFEISGGTFDANGRAVTIDSISNSGTYMARTGVQTITTYGGGGTLTVDPGGLVDVSTFNISGTLTLTNAAMNVSGGWTRTGTFNYAGSTVTFDGTGTQILTGASTFYAFRALTSGATLQFANGTTNYVTSTLQLQNISLKSATNGTTSYFRYNGSNLSVANVRVRDINSSVGSTIYAAANSSNLGNTTNWTFGQTLYWIRNVSGTPANISNSSFWSTSSGGASCTCTPGPADSVVFDGNGISGAIINGAVSVANITATSGYTGAGANDGHLDNSADYNVTVSSAIILDNKQVTMGDGQWSVGGSFDNKNVTTFTADASTLTLSGSGNLIGAAYANGLNHVVISGDYDVPSGEVIYFLGRTTVSGTLTCGVSGVGGECDMNGSSADLYVPSTGRIDGQLLLMNQDSSIQQMDGRITSYWLQIYNRHLTANSLVPATYEPAIVYFTAQANSDIEFLSGTYIFPGEVVFSPAGFVLSVKNNINNPSFIFNKSLDTSNSAGSTSWTKGAGTITFSSNTFTQYADFLGASVENIISSNTHSNGLTFMSSFTTAGFWVNAAGLNSAATVYFQGGGTFTVSTFTIRGNDTYPVVLKSTTSGTAWLLNNTSTHTVSYAHVKDSNATPGMIIDARPISVDNGGNTDWKFNGYIYRKDPSSGSPDSWADPSFWSLTSGGAACSCTPESTDHVVFDANGNGNTYWPNSDTTISSITVTSAFTQSIYNLGAPLRIVNNGTFDGTGTLYFPTTLYVGGNWDTKDQGSLSNVGSTITFNGSGPQVITAGSTMYNVVIANTHASPSDTNDVGVTGSILVNGQLTVSDGQFSPAHLSRFNGVSIGATGILKPESGATIISSGAFVNSGSFYDNDGKVVLAGRGSYAIDSSAYETLILNDGLKGFWRFDDGRGSSTAADSSGFEYNGTLSGMDSSSDWVAGSTGTTSYSGTALDFDGSNDFVSVNSMPELNSANGFTVAAWIKPDVLPFTGYRGVFGRGLTNQRAPWIYGNSGASNIVIHFETGAGSGDGYITTAGTLTQGVWQHIAFTWDGTNVRAYINGTVDANTDITTNRVLAIPDSTVSIGRIDYDASSYWDGQIDDVRVYDRALAPSQISALYSSGHPNAFVSTFTMTGSGLTMYDDLVINSGKLYGNGGDIFVSGSFLNYGGNFENNGSYVYALGDSAAPYHIVSGNQNFDYLSVDGASYELRDPLNANILSVTVGLDVGPSTAPVTINSSFSGPFTARTGTVTYTGGNSFITSPFYNFVNQGSLTLNASHTIDGNLTNSGTIDANNSNNYPITVAGNWANSGTFTARKSTVTLTGASPTLSGHTTFYGLRAISSGSTVYFTAATTQYATNMVDFKNITLRSTTDNATWYFKYSGSSQTITAVRVKDSNAASGTLMAAAGVSYNLGNNTNWSFTAQDGTVTPVISGNWHDPITWGGVIPSTSATVFIPVGHVITATGTIKVASMTIDGTLTLQANATFFWLTANTGSTINQGANRLYFSSKTTLASGTFVKNAGGWSHLVGDFELKQNSNNLGHAIVGASPDTITLTSDAAYDSLTINSGDVFRTNGYDVTITTDVVILNGGRLDTLDGYASNEGDGSIISVGEDWYTHEGSTFSAVAGSTVAFTGSGAQVIIGSATFFNLHINNTAGSPGDAADVDPSSAVIVSNMLTLTDGQFQPASNTQLSTVTINANGILKPDSAANIFVSEGWVNNGTFTHNTGTVTFNNASGTQYVNTGGTGASKIFSQVMKTGAGTLSVHTSTFSAVYLNVEQGTFDMSTSSRHLSVTINVAVKGGTLNALNATMDINGSVYLSAGTLTAPSAQTDTAFKLEDDFYITGTGNFVHSNGRVYMDNDTSGATIITTSSNGDDFYQLTFDNGDSGTELFVQDDLVVLDDFLITNAAILDTVSSESNPITVGGDLTFSVNAVFNAYKSTVTFNGTTQTLTGVTTFYGLRAITSGATLQFAAGTTFYASNMIDLRNVTLKSTVDNATWYFVVTGSSKTIGNVRVRDSNAGILGGNTLNAGASSDNLGNNTNWTFGGGDIYWIRNGSCNPPYNDWGDGTFWSLESGGAACNCVPGPNDHVRFDGNGIGHVQFKADVTISSITATSAYTGSTACGAIDNTLNYTITINNSATFDNKSLNLGAALWYVGRDWDAKDVTTFTVNTSTIIFNGSGAQTITAPATFYNLMIDNTAASPSDSVDVDPTDFTYVQNRLTVNDGQFQPHTGSIISTITINTNGILKPDSGAIILSSGNWTNSGTFTPNNSLLNLVGSGTQLIDSGGVGAGKVFYTFIKSGSGTARLANNHLNVINISSVTAGTFDISTNARTLFSSQLVINGGNLAATSGDLDIGPGDVQIFSGTLIAPSAQDDASFTVAGNWEVSGTGAFSHSNGRVLLDPGSDKTIVTTSSSNDSFYQLKLAAPVGALKATIEDDLDIVDDFLLSNGTFDVKSGENNSINIGGDWNNSGATFNSQSGVVTFNGAGAQYVNGKNFNIIVSSNISSGGVTFSSSFTAAGLTINATTLGSAATVYFAGHSTFTISTFTISGSGSNVVVLKSTDTAQWRLNNTSQNSVTGVQVSSSNAIGNTIFAYSSTGTNTTNWNFPSADTGVRYWIATGTSSWSTAANWSTSSGGPATGGVPTSTHTVIFDSNSKGNALMYANVSVATITISGSTATIKTQSYDLTLSSGYSQSSGRVELGTSVVTMSGTNWAISGGAFDAGTSTVQFKSNSSTNTILSNGTSFYHVILTTTAAGVAPVYKLLDNFYALGNIAMLGNTIFDNAASHRNMSISGNVSLSNTQVNVGSCVWTVGGNWDHSGVTSFNSNTSTVSVTGTGKTIRGIDSFAGAFYILEINGSYTTVGAFRVDDTPAGTALRVKTGGTLTLNNQITMYLADLYVETSATINGSNGIDFNTSDILQMDGTMSCALIFFSNSLTRILPRTYNISTVYWNNSTVNPQTITLSSGTYTFTGQWQDLTSAGSLVIDAQTNHPSITVNGIVVLDDASGGSQLKLGGGNVVFSTAVTLTNNFVSFGSGTYTFNGNLTFNPSTYTASSVGTGAVVFSTNAATANQKIDLRGRTFNNIVSSNTSTAGLTFTSSFTAAALTVDAATLGAAATVYFAGHSTFTISTFTISGSGSNVVVLKSTDTAQWRLNNTHLSSVQGVQVSSSNASAGLAIIPINSTNLGNNTNWIFIVDGNVASVQTGNWHDPNTWGGVVPSTSATVTVTSPNVVTATASIRVSSLTVAGTLTLQGNSTFYWLTTNSGSTFNQGANQIYFSSKTVLATGTFQKNAAGRVYLNGNFDLRQNGQNIGNTIVGLEP